MSLIPIPNPQSPTPNPNVPISANPVALIGTGRLGGALSLALHQAGFQVEYLACKSSNRAAEIAKIINGQFIHPPYAEIENVATLFLTVPDDVIQEIAGALSASPINWDNKTVIHCSGALTSYILSALGEKGANMLSFHPLQTFPPEPAPQRFKGIYFALEGNDYSLGESLAKTLGGIPFKLKAKSKILYHAAACAASNFLYGLTEAAKEMNRSAGIEEDLSLNILIPLMLGTIDSIKEYGIMEGLSGPIARGDLNTLRKHLQALNKHPKLKTYYEAQARWIVQIAQLPSALKQELQSILNLT